MQYTADLVLQVQPSVLCQGLLEQPKPKKPSGQQAAGKAIGDVVRTTCSSSWD